MELHKNGLKNGIYCPNCDTEQLPKNNFCHHCGQKHTDIKRPFWSFFKEFLDTNFNFDSKILRTILPFLFRPGYLTRLYVEGKRTTYFPPLRIYLFVMVFFFIGVGFVLKQIKEKKLDERMKKKVLFIKMDSVYNDVNAKFDKKPDLFQTNQQKDTVKKIVLDAIDNHRDKKKEKRIKGRKLEKGDTLTKENTSSGANISFGGRKIKVTDVEMATLTPEEVIKKYKYTDFWDKLIVTQVMKTNQNPTEVMSDFLTSKLWWLNLLMIPIVAFILKLLYIRRKRFYAEHLIFSFHLSAFLFLLAIPMLFIKMIDDEYVGLIIGIVFIIGTLYTTIAMKNVYQQSWKKTIFKMLVFNFIYFIAYTFMAVVAIVISFFTF